LNRFTRSTLLSGVLALGACATKGDLQRVEDQLVLSRQEAARRDSAAAADLADIMALQQRMLDSLGQGQRRLVALQNSLQSFKGDMNTELYNVQQQLVQVQALTGQSQQRLTDLRTQLDARSEQMGAAARADAGGADSARPAATGPSADQMYEGSLNQLRRGSPGTARMGFQQFVKAFPADPRVADATFFIGESFAGDLPDSAAVYYAVVAKSYPKSNRAPSALYKLGLLAERAKDPAAARGYYQRVVKNYPASDEAALARDRLKSVGS
jgi:tol-pal system protein YbgF